MIRPQLQDAHLDSLLQPVTAAPAAASTAAQSTASEAAAQAHAQQRCFKFERPSPSAGHNLADIMLPSQRIPLLPLATPAEPPLQPPSYPQAPHLAVGQLKQEAQQSSAGASHPSTSQATSPAVQSHPQASTGRDLVHSGSYQTASGLRQTSQPHLDQLQAVREAQTPCCDLLTANHFNCAPLPSYSTQQAQQAQQAERATAQQTHLHAAQQAQLDTAQQPQFTTPQQAQLTAAQQAQHKANIQRTLLGLAPLPLGGTTGIHAAHCTAFPQMCTKSPVLFQLTDQVQLNEHR